MDKDRQLRQQEALGRAALRYRIRQAFPILAITIVICVPVVLLVLSNSTPPRDTQGRPILTATAPVTAVIYEQYGYNDTTGTCDMITIRLAGRLATTRTGIQAKVGDKVLVTYQVGKSGRIYIKKLAPVRR